MIRLLRSRLLTIAKAVSERVGRESDASFERLMGSSIDVAKLVSSMTLFRHLAKQLHAAQGLDDTH